MPPADLAVPFDLVELHERDRREDVGEIRLVPGHGDVVERAVPAPHHPQVVERVPRGRRAFVAISPPSPAAMFFVA